MVKKYFLNFSIIFIAMALISSCKSDDDGLTAIPIETIADFAQVLQTESVSIAVLQNDTNVPTQGIFTVEAPQNGTAQIIDLNNTPENSLDDVVMYTADLLFKGDITFEYTICEGNNCSTGTITVTVLEKSPVILDINSVPYPKLSDYNFFNETLNELDPVYGVLPYEPIVSPFEEYAQKKRFIWMPNDVKASYVNDYSLFDFPVGTILIINFYYENVQPNNTTRIIETRLFIKKQEEWIYADYVWNNEQEEAFYDLDGSFTEIEWVQNGQLNKFNYRIPSESECFTCHKVIDGGIIPIVPKPQNLDKDFHFEDGSMNQLEKWVEMGYLDTNYPNNINHVVDWGDSSQDINLRARSYFDANCSHCHSDTGHCDYRQLRFAFNETENPVKMGVCLDADTQILGLSKIVIPSDTENSILFNRVNTVQEEIRMPLIGRSLLHEEGVQLIEQWINSLNDSCD